MIFEQILNLIYGFLSFIIGLLPDGSGFPSAVHNAFAVLGSAMKRWEPIFPVSDLMVIVGLTITLYLVIFGFNAIIAFYTLVRGGHLDR